MESDTIIFGASFSRQTILLVDDNSDDVFIMRTTFRKAAVPNPLQSVADGDEAIAYFKGEGKYSDRQAHPFPVVVFLDLNMPRRNGHEVLEWIQTQTEPQYRHLTIHVLTASSRKVDVERAFQLGAKSYLIKPSQVEALIELVKSWHCLAKNSGFPQVGM